MWINPYKGAIGKRRQLAGPPNVGVLCLNVMT